MKKKLSIALLLVIAVTASIILVCCRHKHEYTSTVIEPTCTERGYTTYVCECGDSYKDNYVEAKPHTANTPTNENVVGASCTQNGSYDEVVKCKDCNAVISTTHHEVEMTSHTPKDVPARENEVPATCTTLGSYDEVICCKDCNAVISSTPKTIEMLAHTPKSATQEDVVNSTCTTQGSYNEVIRCKDCDTVISTTPKTIGKLPHTPKTTQMENVINATCTTLGSYDEVVRCDVCDEVLSSVHHDGVTLPHTPKDVPARENEVPATCTTAGSYDEVIRCKDCNAVISSTPKATEMLDHTPKSAMQEDVVNSTCSTLGSYNEVIRCKDCNAIITSTPKTIDKLPHTPANAVTENNVPSTCTSQGSYDSVVYCAVCNEQLSVTHNTVAKLPHNYDYGTCKDCGYKIEDEAQFTADGFDIDYTTQPATVSCTVSNATSNIDLVRAFTLQNGSWKLYDDFEGNNEYKLKALSLDYGNNVAYIIVYYDNDSNYFTRYKLDIYRLSVYNYTFADFDGNVLSVGTVEENSTVSAPETSPIRDYYGFDCWTLDGKQVTFPYTATDDIAFTAKYVPTTYNITYVVNGGTFTTNVNDYDVERTVTFDSPTKQYYDFAGWYDNAELNGNALTGIPVGNHDNKTFYAKYTPTIYGITYELNGGTLTTEVNDYDIERAVTFDVPTRDYYAFAGWYSNSAFSGSVIDGITVGNYGTKTVYAKWTPITYGITYELNGGTLTTEVNDYDIECAVTFDTPTKQYYDFVGWYDNEQLNGNALTGIPLGNHDNKTFYAKWALTNYSVSYQLNGGVIKTSETFTIVDLPYTPNPSIPYKDNCFFDGWYKDAGLTESDITITSIDNATIYAKWINATDLFTYQLSSDETYYTVTGYTGTYTDIAIPISHNNTPVTSIGASAFSDSSSLTSITIPDSVTTIGNDAFRNCNNLTSVYYTGNLASWCEINFGSGIGNPLYYAHNLYIDNAIISGDIVIPNGVTKIPSYTFKNSAITSITIPDSVTSIGNNAFYNCSGLASITVPNSVTEIGSSAFSGCSSLESMTLPFVGTGANSGWSSKTVMFGYIFGTSSYAGGTSTEQCYGDDSAIYYIPATLKSVIITGGKNIPNGAFSGCSGLTSITIPDSVTAINPYAFYNCSSLTSIIIPNGVTYIGNESFYNCRSLTSVTIPDSVTTIGNWAFYSCRTLETLYWNATACTSAGSSYNPIFEYCSKLTTVVIGNNVTAIPIYAFYDCSSLKTVYYKGTADDWKKINIAYNNSALTSATRYYYSETEPELNSTGTDYNGNYWYYNDNNEIVVWVYNKENN